MKGDSAAPILNIRHERLFMAATLALSWRPDHPCQRQSAQGSSSSVHADVLR
jgi:hypothetical protein